MKPPACHCFPRGWSCWVVFSLHTFENTEDAFVFLGFVVVFLPRRVSLRLTRWVLLTSKHLKRRNPELVDGSSPSAPASRSAGDGYASFWKRKKTPSTGRGSDFPEMKMANLKSVEQNWYLGRVFATALTYHSLAAGKSSGTFYAECSALLHPRPWLMGRTLDQHNFKSLQSS